MRIMGKDLIAVVPYVLVRKGEWAIITSPVT